MASVLKQLRESATLILVTSSKVSRVIGVQLTASSSLLSQQSDARGDNFDVLLLKRSSNSSFMPSLYVFPGGAAVDSDFSEKWLTVFRKLGVDIQHDLFKRLSEGWSQAVPMFTRKRDPEFSVIPPDVAFRLCAIRETFEESGVLLAETVEHSRSRLNSLLLQKQSPSPSSCHPNTAVIRAWRQKVNDDPAEFLNMCLELDLVPQVWSLYEWSNWLTPNRPDIQRRFDTAFYVCCVDQRPDAVEDAAETVRTLWASPRSLLSAFFEKGEGLALPQVYELSRFVTFQSASDLLRLISQSDRARAKQFLTYTVVTMDYIVVVMPGDDLYPKKVELADENTIHYDELMGVLDKKYPNHNRFILEKVSNIFVSLQCNIAPLKGHVNPDVKFINQYKNARARL